MLVESLIGGAVGLLEVVQGCAGGPAVEGQVAAGVVEVADEVGAEVVGTLAEELAQSPSGL